MKHWPSPRLFFDSNDTSVTWSVNGVAGGSSQVRNDFRRWSIYGAPRSSFGRDGASDCHEPRRRFQFCQRWCDGYERYFDLADSECGECGARRQTVDAGEGAKPRRAGHRGTLGLVWEACPNACGAVDGNGNYTAPQILPASTTVNLTATSVADATRQSTATLTSRSRAAVQLRARCKPPCWPAEAHKPAETVETGSCRG